MNPSPPTAAAAPAPPVTQRRDMSALRTTLLAAALTVGLGLLLVALAGFFRHKVPSAVPSPEPAPPGTATAEVRLVRRQRFETAAGTVRPVYEASVAAKILARVTEVRVKAGQPVVRDEVVVRLDDTDLRARLNQAEAAASGAQAALEKTEADFGRASKLVATGAVSREEYDRATSARSAATAEVGRTTQVVREAQALLDFATIRAPLTGIVIDKRVEVGDTATPGQPLLTLYEPGRMQMVVSVRESLALRLKVGQKLPARLEALGHECEATVSEIVPEAQAASRSFLIKVSGPCPPGAYSGMFGRVMIPVEEEQIVVVPADAVVRIGQLELVRVITDTAVTRRSVRLGRRLDGDVEVLAGLRPGERVVVPTPLRSEGRS